MNQEITTTNVEFAADFMSEWKQTGGLHPTYCQQWGFIKNPGDHRSCDPISIFYNRIF